MSYFARCILFILFLSPIYAYACSLKVASSGQWHVYQYQDQRGRWQGFNFDLLDALTSEAQCHYQVLVVPWKRATLLMESGAIDMVFNFSKMPERDSYAQYIGPYQFENVAFISRKGLSPDVQGIEDLNLFDGLIGRIHGAYLGEEFEKVVAAYPEVNGRFIFVQTSYDRTSMLNMDRIDGAFESSLVTKYHFQKGYFDSDRYETRFVFNRNPIYFGLSKKSVSSEDFERLNKAWHTLLQNGTVEEIFNKYSIHFDEELY